MFRFYGLVCLFTNTEYAYMNPRLTSQAGKGGQSSLNGEMWVV